MIRKFSGTNQETDKMQTTDEYEQFLAELRRETGVEALAADESGLASVRVDDKYNLNLYFIEATGKILCFVEVATLPQDAPAAVYRDLLAAGLFGAETAGGYFAVEKESGTVVYNYVFDFDKAAADPGEFARTLEGILALCEAWDERIRGVLVAEDASDAPPDAIKA